MALIISCRSSYCPNFATAPAEGIALAKAAGKYKGRAKKLTDEDLQEIREKIAAGVPKAKLAREYNVNRTTLYRALERE